VRPEFGGVLIRMLSVGDTFIVESECRRVESECTWLVGVLPALVVSRIRSCFVYFVVSVVITLPFAESTLVESLCIRVDERVVSCGYVVVEDDVVGFVGVVVWACTTAGAATMAAAAMNFKNIFLPPSFGSSINSAPKSRARRTR
jgi:hypothetical protein